MGDTSPFDEPLREQLTDNIEIMVDYLDKRFNQLNNAEIKHVHVVQKRLYAMILDFSYICKSST